MSVLTPRAGALLRVLLADPTGSYRQVVADIEGLAHLFRPPVPPGAKVPGAKVPPTVAGTDPGHSGTLGTADAESVGRLALADLNADRLAARMAPLAWQPALYSAALGHARDLARRMVLDHAGTGGTSPLARVAAAGFAPSAVAENIAFGYPDPRAVVAGWQSDAPHRANDLGPYTVAAVAVAIDRFGRPWWVADFADAGGAA